MGGELEVGASESGGLENGRLRNLNATDKCGIAKGI